MPEYNEYVTAVNKIFDYLSKMRAGWSNQDNFNYIDSINEYKQVVVNYAQTFKNGQIAPKVAAKPEALGND